MAVASIEASASAQLPTLEYSAVRSRILTILTWVTGLGFVVTLFLALFYAGTDATQGNVQRLFYMHVGSFSGGATAFLITVIAGIAYLWKRQAKWDRLAVASVEVGLPLMLITLVTGSVWARPIWNTWWTSDPRLNSMAVMMLLYAAYLTLRAAIDDPERRARFASVYGILAFISVYYVFIVIRVRSDTLHPVVIGDSPLESSAQGTPSLDPEMIVATSVASVWWMLAAITLLWHRLRIENLADHVRSIKSRLLA